MTGLGKVSFSEVRRKPTFLKRILGYNILGIRFDVEIPLEFQGHFRSAGKFNLLTGFYCLTFRLAGFLLDLWLTQPYNLWLRDQVPFKRFLRRMPFSLVNKMASVSLCRPSDDAGYAQTPGAEDDLSHLSDGDDELFSSVVMDY